MSLARPILGLSLGVALPLAAFAQGVPIIDGSRLSNFISRLTEQAEDALRQGEKLAEHSHLSEIEQDQLDAYERFLADTSGVTDLSGFEAGSIRYEQEVFLTQRWSPFTSALAVSSSFRMIATMATFAGFPTWRRAVYLALRSGLKRMATRAGI